MNDLIKKSVEELKKLEEELRAKLFALRFQSAMGNLEKSHRIGELKKQIARILTILSVRKNIGENIAINVKINLNETYAKIEKESQVFAKQHKVKIEQMMVDKQQVVEGEMPSLMDLPLNDSMNLIEEAIVSTGEVNVLDEQKISVAVKKPTVESKTIPSDKTTVTVKSVTSTKADIEVLKGTKKVEPIKTTKKTIELNAKEKLAVIKSSVAMDGITKEYSSGVKIDLELKAKDSNVKEYTYGTNWKENRDKILIAGKTIKKADDKTTKKGIGKK